MSLEVVQAFGWARRAGRRREGWRRYGVPPGGAFDGESFALAVALAGGEEDEAWELGMANVRFRALAAGMVSVVGANVAVTVDGHGRPCQAAFPVPSGAELHVGPPAVGARVYVAFGAGAGAFRRLAEGPSTLSFGPFRVVDGPQVERFERDLLAGEYRVSAAADRVGIRLKGPAVPHEVELPSEPACPGAIQVTNAGGIVILGPDGPTIGGYPQPAVVIAADLDRLGQLRPGDSVSFQRVTLEVAHEQRRIRQIRVAKHLAEIGLAAR